MSLKKAIQHNQSLFIAAIISFLCFGGIAACHLTEPQKKAIIATAVSAAESAAEGSPVPWTRIGLALGTLLGSGAMVDNRRKDVLIKRLKTENANHLKLANTLFAAANNNPSRVPPLCNN
jgi:hypothetical protein